MDQRPREGEKDALCHCNADDIPRHASLVSGVEETVGWRKNLCQSDESPGVKALTVPPLCCVRNISNTKVSSEKDNADRQVEPWHGVNVRANKLKEGENGVQGVS